LTAKLETAVCAWTEALLPQLFDAAGASLLHLYTWQFAHLPTVYLFICCCC
jgi:hypothetical protein